MKYVARLVVVIAVLAVGLVGLQSPASAEPTPPAPGAPAVPPAGVPSIPAGVPAEGGPQNIDLDWGWTNVTVWYTKAETQRIVATNGACSVIVGKIPGWVAKALSGACGLIAVWAGYALARDKCVGVKVSYALAVPYDWNTRDC